MTTALALVGTVALTLLVGTTLAAQTDKHQYPAPTENGAITFYYEDGPTLIWRLGELSCNGTKLTKKILGRSYFTTEAPSGQYECNVRIATQYQVPPIQLNVRAQEETVVKVSYAPPFARGFILLDVRKDVLDRNSSAWRNRKPLPEKYKTGNPLTPAWTPKPTPTNPLPR
jgi:hypothetical protein